MPYETPQDVTEKVKRVLPDKALLIFTNAFNKAYWEKTLPEDRCFMYAWGAVKNAGYRKNTITGMWYLDKNVLKSKRETMKRNVRR